MSKSTDNSELLRLLNEIHKTNDDVFVSESIQGHDYSSTLQNLLGPSNRGNIKGSTFNERLRSAAVRKKELENTDKQQDIELKKTTARFLFILLTIETITIFVMVFLKGFRAGGFDLGDTTLDIITSATLIQVAYMVTIVVSYLFPKGNRTKSQIALPLPKSSPPSTSRNTLKPADLILAILGFAVVTFLYYLSGAITRLIALPLALTLANLRLN